MIKKACVLLTNYLGLADGIRKDMRVLVIDIPLKDIEHYEEINTGSWYRVFSIPDDIVNKCKMIWPSVYSDRGVWKINR